MHSMYLNPAIRELRDQQVRFAPAKKSWNRSPRRKSCWRNSIPSAPTPTNISATGSPITARRRYPSLKFSGREASHDLRLFVEDLSDAANVPAEAAGERVLTVEELARRFNVSTKTISRWRQQGLVSRRFVLDGRKRVGFLESSVDRFVARNADGSAAGASSASLRDEERTTIVDRARRLAQAGGCPAEVTRRAGRARPAAAWKRSATRSSSSTRNTRTWRFSPTITGRCGTETKRKIYQQYRRGESVDALAKRFCRTRTSIYRIIAEMRAQRILELPLDYIPNEEFARVLRREAGDASSRADAAERRAAEEGPLAQRVAALSGQPVRGAAC